MTAPSPIPRNVLGFSLVLAFVLSISALFRLSIPKENKDIVVYMLGQLSGYVAAIVAFHYSSTDANRQNSGNKEVKPEKHVDEVGGTSNGS